MKTLRYRAIGVDYSEDDEPQVLETMGCDCCSSKIPLTQENLTDAIRDAREWLKYLESLTPNA